MKVIEFLEALQDVDDDYCLVDENGNGYENYFHACDTNNFYQEELSAHIAYIKRITYGFEIAIVESIYEKHQDYLDDVLRMQLTD